MEKGYVYLLDAGELLDKNDKEYENYSQVYNKKFGFYDWEMTYYYTLEQAVKDAVAYAKQGDKCYGIVSLQYKHLSHDTDLAELSTKDNDYDMKSVVYNIANFNGKLKENFLTE